MKKDENVEFWPVCESLALVLRDMEGKTSEN
jgi:hypothetical protein